MLDEASGSGTTRVSNENTCFLVRRILDSEMYTYIFSTWKYLKELAVLDAFQQHENGGFLSFFTWESFKRHRTGLSKRAFNRCKISSILVSVRWFVKINYIFCAGCEKAAY